MVILSLGNGWYGLENSQEGPFFWSGETFSLYLETSISELELYFYCNKVKNVYKLQHSLDSWKSFESVSLNSGINVLNISTTDKKRIDFKSDFFIPSQITNSTDNRKLGLQLIRILCKTIDGKCYELDLRELKTKSEIESENSTGEISKESFKITLGKGWHDLEDEQFRWSNGNGIVYIKDSDVESLKLNFASPVKQKIIIRDNLDRVFEFETDVGSQCVFLNDLKKVTFLEIISTQYSPLKDENSIDGRKLGIQLFSIDVSYNENKIKTFLVKNIFFEKEFLKLNNFLSDYKFENKLFNFNSDGHVAMRNFESIIGGKFDLNDQVIFYTHRSGWSYAINSIKSLHSDGGVKFEGFLERTFSWEKYKNIRNNVIPLKNPWVGVIHNPMMEEFEKLDLFSTTKLFNSIVFQKSLENCRGLYVLSKSLKEKIKNRVGNVPVEVLFLPTEPSQNTFTMEKFEKNEDKKIISSGSWARKFLSIFLLKVPQFIRKTMVEPSNMTVDKFNSFLTKEKLELKENFSEDSVETIEYMSSKEYENVLSSNIMFMDFYDVSASNLVVECIVRNTPILIRKHDAVVDYLGKDYPFYFETIQEASDKINNKSLIELSHEYLTKLDTKNFLSGEYFLNSVKNGRIYKSL